MNNIFSIKVYEKRYNLYLKNRLIGHTKNIKTALEWIEN
jgi:hypothetical protein